MEEKQVTWKKGSISRAKPCHHPRDEVWFNAGNEVEKGLNLLSDELVMAALS